MIPRFKRIVGIFLATAGLILATSAITTGTASATTASSASTTAGAIREVPCNNSSYVHVWYHVQGLKPKSDHACFANAGTFSIVCCSPVPAPNGDQCFPTASCWVDEIWTGNNRVQYHGNGQWLPSNGINKNTYYGFPSHPGGVEFDAIRIL